MLNANCQGTKPGNSQAQLPQTLSETFCSDYF